MSQALYNQLSSTDHQAFMDLVVAHSPENLSNDGEASPQMVQRRMNDLRRQWKFLEDKAGFAVAEAWVCSREQEQDAQPAPRARLGARL